MASKTVLHFSDIHFEDPDVYSDNWGDLEGYREEVYHRIDKLLDGRVEGVDDSGVDYALFNGDCGTEEDWNELQKYLEDSALEDWVMVPGNSDQQDYVEYDAAEDLSKVEQNTRNFDIQVGDTGYEILLSHMPQNIGVEKGNSESRTAYMDEDNDRGVPLARDGEHDINATAHYHGEDCFVMEDGKLTVQGGAIGDNYITSDELPEASVQLLEFERDKVTVKHVDFMNLELVEQRTYIYDGEFEQTSLDTQWSFEERFN